MLSLRLDRASENKSRSLKNFALENGLMTEYSPANAHQSNKAAERLIQELSNVMRLFPIASKLHLELWAEAVSLFN